MFRFSFMYLRYFYILYQFYVRREQTNNLRVMYRFRKYLKKNFVCINKYRVKYNYHEIL